MSTAPGQQVGLQILIHPLVCVNISDHYTRAKFKNAKPRVYGMLLGKQAGRKVELFNSSELILNEEKIIDAEYMKSRLEQYNRVFEGNSILGWYAASVTGIDNEGDMALHRQMEEFVDSKNPYFLYLNPAAESSRDLPLSLMEATVKITTTGRVVSFTKVPFGIETTEIERIGVDTVASVTKSGASPLASHLSTLQSAVKMLNSRVMIIKKYLEAVKSGALPADHALLRDISSLCQQLPAIQTNEFKHDFLVDYNDALLITYLAAVTKTTNGINEMMEKFNATYDARAFRRRGMF
jgi:COP9 signalosome complex subunit 6